MSALTRAEARDVVRHQLTKLTSRDEFRVFGTGEDKAGEPASTHPEPSNDLLNEQGNLAVQYLNRKCKLGHIQDVEIVVAAVTADGPYAIPLLTAGVGSNRLTLGDITHIKRVTWDDGISPVLRLTPRNREAWDSEGWSNYTDTAPGLTRSLWIEGYTLYLWPAPDAGGTVHIMAGTGILTYLSDADRLEDLPTDYHKVLYDLWTAMVAGTFQNDVEMLAAEMKYQKKAEEGFADILEWKRDASAQEDVGFTIAEVAVRGTRRTRRGRYGYAQSVDTGYYG